MFFPCSFKISAFAFPTGKLGRLIILPLVGFLCFFPESASPQTKSSSTSFSSLSKQAEEAQNTNRLEEAINLYTKALALRPTWGDGWWSLGTLEYDQDHYAEGAVAFEKLIVLQPKNGTAHAMLGLCQFELGKDELALKNLLAAEQLRVVNNEQLRKVALYHLGLLQLRAGRYGDARETLADLVKQGVKTKEVMMGLGRAVLLVGQKEEPQEGSEGAKVIGTVGEAEALLEVQDFALARQKYGEVAGAFPDFPNLHFAYGRFLLAVHEQEEGVKEFQKELKNNPGHVRSLLEIASVRYRTDSADGVKYAEEAVKLAPQLPFAHYMLGLLLTDTDDYPRAVSELEMAQKYYKDQPEIYFALGNAYAGAGRLQDAARVRATFKRLEAKKGDTSNSSPTGLRPSTSLNP